MRLNRYDLVEQGHQYARDVVSGTIPNCKWVRLACQRYLDDLAACEDPAYPYVFDPDKASRVIVFISALPHTKGKWRRNRERLVLQPWQVFALNNIFGFLHRSTGLRRCREAFLLLPRKQGKSIKAAAIGLYMLCADKEASPEVLCGAGKLKQALEVFTPAKQMVKMLPPLKTAFGLQVWAQQILVEAGGHFQPVVRDPGEGSSPSCWIADEAHQQLDDRLITTFRTGTGAREQPLGLTISTAGSSLSGPCYAMQEESQQILEGTIDRPELFSLIYTIDAGVDPFSEAALRMANPGYDVSVSGSFLRTQQHNARQNARQANAFLTRHLNVWVGADTAFFNVGEWKELGNPNLTPADFRDCPCTIGVDLSSTTDLTATVKIFTRTNADASTTYAIFPRIYAPEDRINDPATPHYAQWHREGHLTATPGSMVSHRQVADDLIEDINRYGVETVAFDAWGAPGIMERVQADCRATCVSVPQTAQHLSTPTKTLEGLILDGRIEHDGNPVMTWALGNVVAREDKNRNIKPNKPADTKAKIDPAMALLTGMSRTLVETSPKGFMPQVW